MGFYFELYFKLLGEKIKKYKIKKHNRYNIDKKGFLVSIFIRVKWVFFKTIFKLRKIKNTIQNKNREWITVIVIIYADGTTLLLGLIY